MSRFLDFIEQQDDEVRRALSIKTGYDETKLFVALLRNHLNGKLTTSSSLAQSSGLSYGTSIRAISSIENRGLLVRRSRTDTGKSFSLHPSEKLILEWQEYARRVHSLLDSTIGLSSKLGQKSSDYFYGSSYNSGSILSPPSVLSSKLSLNKQLRILVHADPTFMAMHVLKKQFESILGVPIQSRALSIDRLREEIIKNSTAKHSNYDIIACDLPWFGEMAEKGRFLPLDNLISNTGFDTSDFHSEALASARYKGNQYGVPVQTTPDLLVYRRDLFESKGLKAPHTIDDTLIAAQTLHSRSRNVSGIAWNAARGTPLGHTFLFTMGAFGQPAINLRAIENGFDGENVIGENFRPMFNTNAARQSAEYLLELLNYSPSSILSMSWYERARAYADGEVGMAYCATLLAPLFELNAKSPAYGVSEFLPHPCGKGSKQIAPVGGYALAIPSNVSEERISPIWTALMSLTSPQTIKLYIENGSLVSPRFSVSMDPKVRQISPLISKVDEMARFGVLQMWPRPPVPEISNIIAIAGEEMHDMLIGVKSIDEALNNSQNRADAIMRMNGHY
jgi:multiple sugar transport system substrate-binding protein